MQRPQYSQPHSSYRSSRRRRSAHFRLNDLPVELRLLVIEFSLPLVNDVSRKGWPEPIPALFRTSKQFNTDTRHIMERWSPIHYVPTPLDLQHIPRPGPIKIEHICLSMFHDARINVLRSGPQTHTRADDHQDMVLSWMTEVDRLPLYDSIKSITIDATPAPGWLRYDKPSWIPNLINDKSVSDRFIYEHIAVIADLLMTIASFYNSLNHPVEIELSGLYGQRSRSFPDYIRRRCATMHLQVPFRGLIVPDPPPPPHPISIPLAINDLFGTTTNLKTRLQLYNYSPTSDFLFQNYARDHPTSASRCLEILLDFVLEIEDDPNARPIDLPVRDFAHGSLICSLARDLGLATEPWTKKRDHWIRVRRGPRHGTPRQWGATSSSSKEGSSLFGLLLMSAAVVLFVGVLSNGSRRQRR